MSSIPASMFVQVTPNVISAGGSALDLSGLILTTSTRPPIGTVQSFASSAAVAAYFGSTSAEAGLAAAYFGGFDNSNVKPGALLMAQYPTAPVGAYLRGGNISGMSIATLAGLSGTLTLTIAPSVQSTQTISLTGATSFSGAAKIISNSFGGTTGPQQAVFTGSISATTLTVSAVTSGTIVPGQVIAGTGVTSDTYILAQLTGTTGGVGTYSVDTSQTAASETITSYTPFVTYDPILGAFVAALEVTGPTSITTFATGTLAASLLLTQATGAVLSQGAAAGVPATNMDAVVNVTQNWASFTTAWEPSTSDKQAFAAWTNGKGNRYLYAMWTVNPVAAEANDTTTAGALIRAANDSGTALIYAPTLQATEAAFVLGCIASIDFGETNGRATLAFKGQTGLTPDVTDQTSAENLVANGYNFYAAVATANDKFNFFTPGSVTGPFLWIDSYVNQIWLNNQLQLSLMTLLTGIKSIPYNRAGYALIEAACMDPINAALNFGAIRAGVTLSALQAAEVNNAAGAAIDGVLSTRGWYLQVKDATAQVRAARGSPPCTLWYMDGQSVQTINLTSVEVQ